MKLTRKLQLALGLSSVALFFVLFCAVRAVESRRAFGEARELAARACDDMAATISRMADKSLISVAGLVATGIDAATATDELARAKRDAFAVTEVHVIDTNGVIVATTVPADKFYRMDSGEQSAEFLRLLHGETEFAQRLRPKANGGDVMRYAGVSLPGGGFLQVALDEEAFRRSLVSRAAGVTETTPVGIGGYMIVATPDGTIVSAPKRLSGLLGTRLSDFPENRGGRFSGDGGMRELFRFSMHGVPSFGWYDMAGEFPVLVVQPASEIFAAREKMLQTLLAAGLPVAVLFVVCFHFVLKRIVTDDVVGIDDALKSIAAGDFARVVDCRSCEEFASISDNANAAAAALKRHATEEKERLERERDAAVASEKARNYFFSTVSHDIRTPLNAIIGFSQILKLGAESEEERVQCIDGISSSGEMLMQLVNDVLDLSKLEAGKMVFKPVWCDAAAIANGTLPVFAQKARERGLELGVDSDPDLPRILVDPHRLRQVLFNFLGNAMKFTERGGVRVRIARVGADRLDISVADTGCGIPAEEIGRLGSPFVQLDRQSGRGTGLGLAICKQLIARMGGTLRIESEPGKGSVFTAALSGVKFEDASARAEGAGRPGPDGGNGRAGGRSRIEDWAGRRILLVDDLRINLLVLSKLCRKLGLGRVETAQSADEALQKLRAAAAEGAAARYALVLTDLWMPGTGGAGLAEAVRSDPALAGTRVCAVTADVEILKSQTAKNFAGVLLKPVLLGPLREFFENLEG